MPWKHWSAERLGLALAVLAALGFSFKAIFVKLAYAVPQPVAVDAVTLLALRMAFSLPFFAWMGWRAHRAAGGAGLDPQAAGRSFRARRFTRLAAEIAVQRNASGCPSLTGASGFRTSDSLATPLGSSTITVEP